jgi:hypothetical protein
VQCYFCSQVRELREIVQKHNLENRDGADINGVTAPEAQLLRLGELVETMNSIHSRALRMEGGTAAGLVSASVERCVLCSESECVPQSDSCMKRSVPAGRPSMLGGRRAWVAHLAVSWSCAYTLQQQSDPTLNAGQCDAVKRSRG